MKNVDEIDFVTPLPKAKLQQIVQIAFPEVTQDMCAAGLLWHTARALHTQRARHTAHGTHAQRKHTPRRADRSLELTPPAAAHRTQVRRHLQW